MNIVEPLPTKQSIEVIDASLKIRITGLDELRGIAILSVLIAHFFHLRSAFSQLRNFNLGGIGVDLFFVISGFLISKILISSRGEPKYFRKFYVRRIFRIVPLFLVVLIAAVLVQVIQQKYLRSLPFYLIFSQNLLAEMPPIGDLLPENYRPLVGLGPLWSLAVEEHMYLLLPLIIALIPVKYLNWPVAAIATLGIGLKAFASLPFVNSTDVIIYFNPHETWFRMQYIAFGILLTLPNQRITFAVLFVGWVSIIFLTGFGWFELVAAIILLTAVKLCTIGRPPLRNRLLARIGVLCYGIYLLHPFLMIGLEKTHLPILIQLPLFILSCAILSEVSFRMFEIPIQTQRKKFE